MSLPSSLVGRFFDSSSLVSRLRYLGWLPPADPTGAPPTVEAIKTILEAYQRFHGLPVSATLSRETERSLQAHRFCHHPDVFPGRVAGSLADTLPSRWPGLTVTWHCDVAFTGLTVEQTQEAFRWACAQWMAVCGLNLVYDPNSKTANIVADVGPIDGAAGVLAYSMLADDSWTQKQQRFDSGEAWVLNANPSGMSIDAARVIAHELGHAFGLPHIEAGNLLQPTYDPRIRSPQGGDAREMVARYGPPVHPAPPPLGPQPAQEITITIRALDVKSLQATGFTIVKA